MLILIFALIAAGALIWAVRSKPSTEESAALSHDHLPRPAPAAPVAEPVPPYFASAAAARPLPRTLAPERFAHPAVVKAYRVARQIPEVLAQQPCYCWCDKFGHGSLLDCFASDHGAG
jgi:hypothetical protein